MAQVTKGSFNTSDYGNRYLTFSWEKTGSSTSGCYTDIKWTLKGAGGGTSNYYYAGSYKLVIDGDTVFTSADRIQLFNGTEVASGTKRIYHNNSTGNKTFSAYAEMAIYYKTINATGEGSWELPTIPRYASISHSLSSKTETSVNINWSSDSTCDYLYYSKNGGSSWAGIDIADGKSGTYTISGLSANTTYNIKTRVRRKDSQLTSDSSSLSVTTYNYPHCTNSPNFTIGDLLTLSFYNPLSRLISVTFIGGNDEELATDTTAKTTLSGYNSETFIDKLYESIKSSNIGIYKIKVTYNNVSKTRNNGNYYQTNPSDCEPDFENFTYKDTNTKSTDITGNDQVLIKGFSNVDVTISSANKMVATKHAEPSRYIATMDGLSANAQYSESDITFNVGTILNAGTKRLTVNAYDSRDNYKEAYKDITVLDYAKPVVNVDVSRLNKFENETTLKVNGTLTKLIINDTDKNALQNVSYRYREVGGNWSEWTTINTTVVDNKFTCSDVILSLDNSKAFDFEVKATDKLDEGLNTSSVDIGVSIFLVSTNMKACYINNQKIIMYDVIKEW